MSVIVRLATFLSLLLLVSAGLCGQDSVEGRLLEILKVKGIIDEKEHGELLALEHSLREEADLSVAVEQQISEMVGTLEDTAPTTSYKIGKGFRWDTPDKRFSLRVHGRMQLRFTYDWFDKNPGTNDQDEADFDNARTRIYFAGHTFEPYLKYLFHFELFGDPARSSVPDGVGGSTSVSSRNRLGELRDAVLDFTKWKEFSVAAGQMKIPYSRHWINSSATTLFVERSITHRVFFPDRSVGLLLHGRFDGAETQDVFGYHIGVFDGDGENSSNNDKGLLYSARFEVSPWGNLGYNETDFGHREDFRAVLGVNGYYNQDDNHVDAGDDWAIGADLAMAYQGFWFNGEIHYREDDIGAEGNREIFGWVAQLGYALIPNSLEVGLRAANIDWVNNGLGVKASREYLLVVNKYLEGHQLKIQIDFGRSEFHFVDTSNNIEEWRLRAQFQVHF